MKEIKCPYCNNIMENCLEIARIKTLPKGQPISNMEEFLDRYYPHREELSKNFMERT